MNYYGLFISLAVIIDCSLISYILHNDKVEYYKFLPLSLANFFAVFIGGKTLGMIQSGKTLIEAPLSSMGGFVASIIAVMLLGLLLKINFQSLAKAVTIPLPLTYSVSKIGCAFAGCCYGVHYTGIGHVYSKFDHCGYPVFPVQITETIVFFIIFAIFFTLYKKNKFNTGAAFGLILTCCAAKGLLYYLRDESIYNLFGPHQVVICAVALLVFVSWSTYDIIRKKKLRKGENYYGQ